MALVLVRIVQQYLQQNLLHLSPFTLWLHLILGDLAIEGGQNYWDVSDPGNLDNMTAQGTFRNIRYNLGCGYNTDDSHYWLVNQLSSYKNIILKNQYDFTSYSITNDPYRIKSITINNIYRNSNSYMVYGSDQATIMANIFIDASEDGKMARVINSAVTTGRFDFPSSALDALENTVPVGRQQAATLMLKLKNINISSNADDMNIFMNSELYGGGKVYTTNAVVKKFNDTYASQGYMIKSINAARNGYNSDEWWINSFLIFNVDGRLLYRDRNNSLLYPAHVISGSISSDECWIRGRNFLKQHEMEVRNVFRQFQGFEQADFVFDSEGYPIVREVPYIRETVHMAKNSEKWAHGTENQNYAVTENASLNAGSGPNNGPDSGYYNTRIGVALYGPDIHPYKYTDYKNSSGNYIFGMDSYKKIRKDLTLDGKPEYPVYLPYSVLTTNYVANLLNPGYATSVSAFSWGEIRVLPTLCVLGDAAGATAAYCSINNIDPLYVTNSGIRIIQNNLVNTIGARLNK